MYLCVCIFMCVCVCVFMCLCVYVCVCVDQFKTNRQHNYLRIEKGKQREMFRNLSMLAHTLQLGGLSSVLAHRHHLRSLS